jgi:D-3-phosphoglycerate dehydrogenase
MGSAFAEKLSGFDVNVIAYDKYKSDYSDRFVKEVDMPSIYKEADVLSLHVPLTDETHYLVNDHFLGQFNKPIILINTSRGPVVDTSSLVRAMKSAKVTGAALDVIEYEKYSLDGLEPTRLPDPMKYLLTCDNVILTPHVAGWTHESQVKLSTVLLDKIKKEFEI